METLEPFSEHALDENGYLRLRITPAAHGRMNARLSSTWQSGSELVRHLLPLITAESGDATLKPEKPEFSFTLPVTIKANGRTLLQLGPDGAASGNKLSVFDTRSIGRARQEHAPYPLDASLFEGLTPVTDLHTHLSGQVSASALIAMGRQTEENVCYPLAALGMLGIGPAHYDAAQVKSVPRRIFLPIAHLQSTGSATEDAIPLSSLSPDALATLERGMRLSPENQNTFGAMEKCYYLREPFTKSLRFLGDILRAVAQQYHLQGVRYAELSSTEMLNPLWLKEAHRVLPSIEDETGVALRFKIGLPRNLEPNALNERIERYKRIAASPYVAGVDLLGYEVNKTLKMEDSLTRLLAWMQEHQPGDIMQIHAGENAKNLDNVREAMALVLKHSLRLQVGHSLYGVDDEALRIAAELAQGNRIIAQFNLDSNLALNNIDFPDAPLHRFLQKGIPCVLGSDGADLHSTSARQMAMAAAYCGLTRQGFQQIRATEEAYIVRQREIFAAKQKAFARYATFDAFLADSPEPAQAAATAEPRKEPRPARQDEKLKELLNPASPQRPVFFGGAGGKSWDKVPAASKNAFAQGLRQLLTQLDPGKVYFVKGRTKQSGGVNNEIENAIRDYNAAHPTPFHCVTLLAESEDPERLEGAFHTLMLETSLMGLTDKMVELLKERNGIAFYIGGNNFTRDFILTSFTSGIPFALMRDAAGASAEKAAIYQAHAFEGAWGLVAHARKMAPELFI